MTKPSADEPMRISLVTPYGIHDGIASYSQILVEALRRKKDVAVRVVKLPKSSNPLRFLIAGLRCGQGADIIHVQYQQACFGSLLDVRFLRSINFFPFFFMGLIFYKLLGRKILYTIHELNPKNPLQVLMLPAIWISADAIIVHSRELASILERSGFGSEILTLLPFPLKRKAPLDKKRSKAELGLPPDKKVVLMFGFIHPNKGLDLAVPASQKFKSEAVFLVVGSPRIKGHESYYAELKKSAEGSGMLFHGYIPEEKIPLYMSAADIALVPYKWIQNSLVINLFLSYSLPVLSSDLEYFLDIEREFGCVETFRSGDAEDLARKLGPLLRSPERREELSGRASRFLSESDISKVVGSMLCVYAHLARRPRRHNHFNDY